MVPVRGEPGHARAGCVEGTSRRVQEARHGREAVHAGGRAEARLGMPVVRVRRRDVVHHAFVLRQVTGVRAYDSTVQEVDEPAQLVVLTVVGVVPGGDRELNPAPTRRATAQSAHLADHRVPDVCAEELLRPVGTGEAGDPRDGQRPVRVEELETGWGLAIHHVDVRELGETGENLSAEPARSWVATELGTQQVRLAGCECQRCVATGSRGPSDDGPTERRPGAWRWRRGCDVDR